MWNEFSMHESNFPNTTAKHLMGHTLTKHTYTLYMYN